MNWNRIVKRDDSIARIEVVAQACCAMGATALYVFGSTARHEAMPSSDVGIFFGRAQLCRPASVRFGQFPPSPTSAKGAQNRGWARSPEALSIRLCMARRKASARPMSGLRRMALAAVVISSTVAAESTSQ